MKAKLTLFISTILICGTSLAKLQEHNSDRTRGTGTSRLVRSADLDGFIQKECSQALQDYSTVRGPINGNVGTRFLSRCAFRLRNGFENGFSFSHLESQETTELSENTHQ